MPADQVRAYLDRLIAEQRPASFLAAAGAEFVSRHAALLGFRFTPRELAAEVDRVRADLAAGRLAPEDLISAEETVTTCQSPRNTLAELYGMLAAALEAARG